MAGTVRPAYDERMRIFSRVVMWVGIVAAVAGLGFGLWGGFMVWQQYLALDALRSAPIDYPFAPLWAGGGLLLVGGYLAGLGTGLTSRAKAQAVEAGQPAQPLPPNRQDIPATDREPTPPPAG